MNLLDIALPQLSQKDVHKNNLAIKTFANRVYDMGDMQIYLCASETLPKQAVHLQILYLGQEFDIWVDLAMVNTFLAPFALRLEKMSQEAIALFLLTHVDKMPKNIQILDMCLEKRDFYAHDYVFEVMSYDNAQSTNWRIAIKHAEKFPLKHLAEAFVPYLKGVMSHAWLQLPIAIPLVIGTLSVPATEIPALAVGDVIFLEGSA